jgi:hypothetical protein
MRWSDVDLTLAGRIDPTVGDPPGWECKDMFAFSIDHCKLKIAIEWSGGNGLPHVVITEAAVLRALSRIKPSYSARSMVRL